MSYDLVELIRLFIKAFVVANLVMVVFALMTWVERRVLGFFQLRLGPNRVGPFGLLQPIADLLKLIRKENFEAGEASRILHVVAPVTTLLCALGTFCVIPFGPDRVNVFGWHTPASMAGNLSVGLLLAIALSGLGGYGVIVGGWASNSKYALLGALRACAQLISYEVSLTLAILPVVMLTGSLSMQAITSGYLQWDAFGWSPWFVLWAPLGFAVFCLAALAEANRAPFDHAEAEQELVAGFHTEFGGLRYALFANAEYVHMISICAIGVVAFFGGWHGPWVDQVGWGLGVLWFMVKLMIFMFIFIWIRATVPRLRYDRLMRFGWKVMLPAATVQFLVIAVVAAYPNNEQLRNGIFAGTWVVTVGLMLLAGMKTRMTTRRMAKGHAERAAAVLGGAA